jgi:hypothetical protein
MTTESNQLVWDERLISPSEVLQLASHHLLQLEIRHHITDQETADAIGRAPGTEQLAPLVTLPDPTLTCGDCGQTIRTDAGPPFTLLELASDILRHRVNAHGEVLSGRDLPGRRH